MIRLVVKPHEETGGEMVQVWDGDVFVAGVYPHEDGVRVVSKYLDGVDTEPVYPPAVVVKFSRDEPIKAG